MASEDTRGRAFGRRLQALKREGASLLVVADASCETDACTHLLGASDRPRSAVFLTATAGVADARRRWGRDPDPENLGVVDVGSAVDTRAPNAQADGSRPPNVAGRPDPDAAWYTSVDALEDVPGALAAVADHVDRLSAGATGPGEVRLCVDSLDPYFDALSDGALFRFVHLLTAAVRDADGLGHVHVSEAVPGDRRATLDPLFDATVEVRACDAGACRQRWRLHDSGVESDWLSL